MIELLPIQPTFDENHAFSDAPECQYILHMTLEYYKTIGFHRPWIGYFAKMNNRLVGSAGYKGGPVNNTIEIAYGTFPGFMSQGIGTAICKELVNLSLKTDPAIIITARTLPEHGHSTSILEKNGFRLLGTVWDKDDGDVWEWKYPGSN